MVAAESSKSLEDNVKDCFSVEEEVSLYRYAAGLIGCAERRISLAVVGLSRPQSLTEWLGIWQSYCRRDFDLDGIEALHRADH